MRVLVIEQGPYGERIARNIKERSPEDWEVQSFKLTTALPPLIDDPEDFLPPDLPASDLIVFLSETEQSPQLIPDIVAMTGAKQNLVIMSRNVSDLIKTMEDLIIVSGLSMDY